MKTWFIIYIAILVIACNASHPTLDVTDKNLDLSEDQEYSRQQFKRTFLKTCIFYGFNPEDRNFMKKDISFESDYALGKNGYKIVDSLISIQMVALREDSIFYFDEIKSKDADYLGRKRVLQICLNGYESQKIDSIAIAFAKQLSPSTSNR